MKAKKQKINTYTHLEKILTLAGLILVVVGCIANLYSAYTNLRFINEPFDYIYYFRYVILLGGGFAVGYLCTKKKTPRHTRLFLGVVYAVLAIALFWIFDIARLVYPVLFGSLAYPLEKIAFMGAPLMSFFTVLIVAFFSQYKPNRFELSTVAKLAIILSFIGYEVYSLVSGVYYLIIGTATYDPNTPLWQIVSSYLLIPLVIAAVVYLLFGNIKKRFDRLFYAVFIGMLYSTFIIVLWGFRTDPTSEATNIFSNIVTGLSLLLLGILLWRARKAIK